MMNTNNPNPEDTWDDTTPKPNFFEGLLLLVMMLISKLFIFGKQK